MFIVDHRRIRMATTHQVHLEIPTLAGLEAYVGNTPLLPLPHIGSDLRPGVQILAKAEWFNPGGSVKDRPALNIIRRAIELRTSGAGQTPVGFHFRQYGHRLCHLLCSAGYPGDPWWCLRTPAWSGSASCGRWERRSSCLIPWKVLMGLSASPGKWPRMPLSFIIMPINMIIRPTGKPIIGVPALK